MANIQDRPRDLAQAFLDRLPVRERRAVLGALAASIRRIHARAPNAWGLTFHKGGRSARLNAGRLEAFTLLPDGVKLLVVGTSTKRAGSVQGSYRSVPEAAPRFVPYSEFPAGWRKLRQEHFALIERAAPAGRGYGWRRYHSEVLLDCIAELLGVPLPSPGYPSENDDGDDQPPGYLMLWNGQPDRWEDRAKTFRTWTRTGAATVAWTCGDRKRIPVGSRVFLKRTGLGRGIVASGHTMGPVQEEGNHSARVRSVPIRIDAMVDPDSNDLLTQASFEPRVLQRVNWNPQRSGMEVHGKAARELEVLWFDHLRAQAATAPQAALTQDRSLSVVRRLARDSRFARLVRGKGRGACAACGGGRSYVHANILEAAHIRSVEHKGPDELSNALLLCPNHHALFDQGFWTVGAKGRTIVKAEKLPADLEDTFGAELVVSWPLDERQLAWHRTNVFLGRGILRRSRSSGKPSR